MTNKVILSEADMPRQWYNIAADLPHAPLPPLGPDGAPVNPAMLAAVFPENLLEQEMSTQRNIDIPEEVLAMLYKWRPTPLVRAFGLEKAIGTSARIYYKNESVSPAGSHKPNTAVAQAYYNKIAGIKKLTTETGAGQWGSALSFATALMGLELKVFMVKSSYVQKPYRKMMMEVWGARCIPSPSHETEAGKRVLEENADSPGSLGIAISEAVEAAIGDKEGNTRYALGSVLNHVMLHQTIIGLEAKKQLEIFNEKKVDAVVACAGGGSNFAGLAFPFIRDKINGDTIEIYPVEPASCPTLTRGKYTYDLGDVAGMTPLLPMHTLGHSFMPPTIHAGGLRYHGMSPLVSQTVVEGLATPVAIPQLECYEAAVLFARSEGIIVAPETSHAIAQTIRLAKHASDSAEHKVILFGLSGHGLLDLGGYASYFAGELCNHHLEESIITAGLSKIKGYPAAVLV